MEGKLFRLPLRLRIATWVIVCSWLVLAVFPLFWLLVMSFKLPLDAFDENPLVVVFGPGTSQMVGGISAIGLALALGFAFLLVRIFVGRQVWLERLRTAAVPTPLAVPGFYAALVVAALLGFALLVPLLSKVAQLALSGVPLLGVLVEPVLGSTTQHYHAVWIENEFYRHFVNTMVVTTGVVTISLTIGTLAAYALARTRTSAAFWLLIVALVFRALPHSTLVSGYLPPFIEFGLYGKRIAVIIVLVAINQPFTIWMLRSFFMNIPQELDEAALVDGCNRLQAFWRVIMPIMWPGVITTGLFSFMLAYNDFLVSALLLDGPTRTMVPAIMQYFNRETTLTDQLEAIAAAASITGPLFLLVLFFQRQIVSGLTQGAVKG
jgi:multiple sugar transport system permease protein